MLAASPQASTTRVPDCTIQISSEVTDMRATQFLRGMSLLAFSVGVLQFIGSGVAVAESENVLHSFRGGSDGTNPSTGLVADSAGNLFGTTTEGGSAGCGVVYELKASHGGRWTESVIYTFLCGADGAAPSAGLVFDAAGNLYGTTLTGGKNHDGTVFELMHSGGSWTETTLHTFSGKDGSYPAAGLVFDQAGNLYGTTLFGGHAHGGVAFQLTLSGGAWTETVLHNFTGRKDGIDPAASLILDQSGVLYGTTMGGTIFELMPPKAGLTKWMFKNVFVFDGGQDDGPLSAGTLLLGKNGVLYGTQKFGNGPANAGAVFQLTPPAKQGAWSETTIYRFIGGSDGLYPFAGVISDAAGNLYGTTAGDGKATFGTVFKLSPPAQQGSDWAKTTLYAFSGGADGSGPGAGLIFGKGGALLSTTAGGGAFGDGTVFEVVP
jgi:uncharacterized repeat protein (TIGR03803 family)